ncbi:hypothetical protein BABINDRAFT_158988 [Babjeviella inositovora NRRL Y-12698]|uniref:Uncharacterized protein n=1 Tax=Babjeviella inositovora NRRL Y-12698 TaxID=984486 RepID=A0A1E3QXP1_9ASCO|nr:uncharacterized protein BABINDRAFT_158988 [Babjeviella inositovora NRRL Y-12698]ODQ82381.1 hypothetical protein BABINDRAFT_158988 [Babjeviella inositovora NRRL Y-12698]
MRPSNVLSKYTQLIKFGKPTAPKHINHAPQPHPCAPNGVLPSGSSASSGATSAFYASSTLPPAGHFFSRAELPQRFRYPVIEESEIDDINSGGAEILA